MECRLAAALLARGLGANAELAASIKTLKEVEGLIEAQHGPGVQGQEAAVKALLHEGSYLQDEVSAIEHLPLLLVPVILHAAIRSCNC